MLTHHVIYHKSSSTKWRDSRNKTPHGMDDIVEKSMPLINELVEIAGKIEVVP